MLTAQQALALSVAECKQRCRFDEEADLAELDRWYESGRQLTTGPAGDLMRKEGEGEEDWKQRVARMANVNVLARIVDTVASWIYRESPHRSLGLETEESLADELLDEQLGRMRMGIVEKEGARGQVLRGTSWDSFGWRPKEGPGDSGNVTVRAVRRQDVYVEYSPFDPYRPTLLIHRVAAEESGLALKSAYLYRIWTDGQYMSVDDSWNGVPLTPEMPWQGKNPFGLIPYSERRGLTVPGTERCLSLVRDVVGHQRLVLNKLSDLDQLVRYQSGDVMVVKSHLMDEMKTGHNRFVRLPAEPNVDLFFASPSAKIADALDVVKYHIESSFQTCGLPVTVLTGDQTESGFALMVRYQQAAALVRDYQRRAAVGEEHALRVICAVGRYGGLALPDPWAIKPVIEFAEGLFPADDSSQRLADLRELEVGILQASDFVRRNYPWVPEDQVEEYAANYTAGKAADRAASGFAGFLPGPPAPEAAL